MEINTHNQLSILVPLRSRRNFGRNTIFNDQNPLGLMTPKSLGPNDSEVPWA
jgi:hypothetical protein